VKPIPEKLEYRPARLGYFDTQFSKVYISTLAGTLTTTTLSKIIFYITPKVIAPASTTVSIRKLPLFIIAISALLSNLYIDTIN